MCVFHEHVNVLSTALANNGPNIVTKAVGTIGNARDYVGQTVGYPYQVAKGYLPTSVANYLRKRLFSTTPRLTPIKLICTPNQNPSSPSRKKLLSKLSFEANGAHPYLLERSLILSTLLGKTEMRGHITWYHP